MPFKIMDQRGGTTTSSFCDDFSYPPERQVGFWKSSAIPDELVGSDSMGRLIASSPLEKPPSSGTISLNGKGDTHSIVAIDDRETSCIAEGTMSMLKASQKPADHFSKPWKTSSVHQFSHSVGKPNVGNNGSQWESSLFSSSFSDVFNRNVRLSGNDSLSKNSSKVVNNPFEEEEPFEASEEIEAKTIGNLLPTEDDLYNGISCDFGSNGRATGGDDTEDFDLFSCGGGMELEGDDSVRVLRHGVPGVIPFGQRDTNGCVVNASSYGKHSPSYDVRVNDIANHAIHGDFIKQEQNYATSAKCLLEQSELKQIDNLSRDGPFGVLSSRQIAFSPGVTSSSCMENGAVHSLHPAIQAPMSAYIDAHRMAGVGPNISSPFPGGRQVGLLEPNANHGVPNLHPHSLPEYHDNLTNGFQFNSPTGIGGMTNHMPSKMRGGITNASVRGVGPSGRLIDVTKVSGSPVNGSSSPGHRFLWNKSSSDWQHLSNQIMWSSSPSFARNANPHHVPNVTGFSGPPVLLPTTPVHHVGSAPAVDPSLWDRRNAYTGDLSETSNLHMGSLGNPGFPLRSLPHQLDAVSPNIFSRVGAGLLDMSKHTGVGSPQRIGNNFPGRNVMISIPASYDSSTDRGRSFPQRRVDSNSNPCDRKQYELDIDRIMRGEDTRTTLMIKNIPNKYTSKMLLAAIDEHCRGTYDFIYLPIDFKNKCNVGYAFINMIDPEQIISFHNAFNGKKWEKFNSEKVTNLAYARIQGKAALVAHFQNSSLMNEDKRCRPILFRTDGPNAGDPEPFPVGPNVRLKVAKSRSSGNDENHQPGNLSTVVNVEDSGNGTDSSNSD